MKFRADGTYHSSAVISGVWRALDEKTLWFKNKEGNQYTLGFSDDYGSEAVLIVPARDPPSKMRVINEGENNNDYFDIWILSSDAGNSKELEKLAISDRTKCCLVDQSIHSLFTGFARVVVYLQNDAAASPSYMVSLYEGEVKNGQYNGFGRFTSAYS